MDASDSVVMGNNVPGVLKPATLKTHRIILVAASVVVGFVLSAMALHNERPLGRVILIGIGMPILLPIVWIPILGLMDRLERERRVTRGLPAVGLAARGGLLFAESILWLGLLMFFAGKLAGLHWGGLCGALISLHWLYFLLAAGGIVYFPLAEAIKQRSVLGRRSGSDCRGTPSGIEM